MTTQYEANAAQGARNEIDFWVNRFEQQLKNILDMAVNFIEDVEAAKEERADTELTHEAVMEMINEHFVVTRARLTETADAVEDKYDAEHDKTLGPDL